MRKTEASTKALINPNNNRKSVKDKVLAFIIEKPYSRTDEISKYLGLDLHAFSGRLSDLQSEGLIVEMGESKGFSEWYPVLAESMQEIASRQRRLKQYQGIIKRLSKFGVPGEIIDQLNSFEIKLK